MSTPNGIGYGKKFAVLIPQSGTEYQQING